eukprot:CAMPEP_0114538244 /NCGR_PEP_ID=MMETSP0109-20121206/30029_1 /TAXON_ID=29199 /ORGANISM="Chlorarachnion reptans, Strain CCCM449" /LENGTH=467 /DNA_ID=CAMNT_0001722229 /DNA_START=49 /DNA_END=1450 /DNA_ORIENTATION=-
MPSNNVALFLLTAPWLVSPHGILTKPASRALYEATNKDENGQKHAGSCPMASCQWYNQDQMIPGKATICDPKLRTMGVSCTSESPIDWPCAQRVPWCAPGTAPVKSPCGIFSGGWGSNGRDMLDLEGVSQETWKAGSIQEVSWSIIANHGGGYAYRLCKKNEDELPSEECFQENHLKFVGDKTRITNASGYQLAQFPAVRTSEGTWPKGSTWSVNPVPMEDYTRPLIPGLPGVYGRGPFFFNIVDEVRLRIHSKNFGLNTNSLKSQERGICPQLALDAEQTKQVWMQCSDVTIVDGNAHSWAEYRNRKRNSVCVGESLGLDVGDCNAWVDFYDALNGPGWPHDASLCPNLRLDPCGCKGGTWQTKIVCIDKRDYLRISEIYIETDQLKGVLPDSVDKLTSLVAFSIVGSNLRGPIPETFGNLVGLEMIWLDHNSQLGGPLPSSMKKLTKLTALELHHSNFSGLLPPL